MPCSMTGFGRGSIDGRGRRYIVEVRSVNNRYLEVKVSVSKEFLELEHLLSLKVRESFARGKFDLILKTERLSPKEKGLDAERIVSKWKELEKIRKKLRLADPVSLETAVGLVPAGNNAEEPDPSAKSLFLRAADRALGELRDFRKREGKNLAKDILRRTIRLDAAVSRISEAEKRTKPAQMEKLRTRLAELLSEPGVDPKRIETEAAIQVDRADVSEEIVRLRSHVGRLKELALADRDVGRETDFLLQEMNREINTIGSKSSDLGTVDEVILAKSEIEKIREQAQNLE
ncbi:MAG: YicC/YloC family endoribonuclease [Pseudomonadota bacterium]